METLSIQRPRPSIEIRTPAAASVPVNAALVNWLPWSVLKIASRPKRASACSIAKTQNDCRRMIEFARSAPSLHPGRHIGPEPLVEREPALIQLRRRERRGINRHRRR
jgi:hypothetical protein